MGGALLLENQENADAWDYLEESLVYARKSGVDSFLITPLIILVESAVITGNHALAWKWYDEGIRVLENSANQLSRQSFKTKRPIFTEWREIMSRRFPFIAGR